MHHSNNSVIITDLASHGWVLNHTHLLCRMLCFGTHFLNWFNFFSIPFNCKHTGLQSSRTPGTKSKTRDTQTGTTGILISLCGLLECGPLVTSATCVSQVRRAPMANTAKQDAALPGLEVLLIPWSLSTGNTKLLLRWQGHCVRASQHLTLIYSEFWREWFRFTQERLF